MFTGKIQVSHLITESFELIASSYNNGGYGTYGNWSFNPSEVGTIMNVKPENSEWYLLSFTHCKSKQYIQLLIKRESMREAFARKAIEIVSKDVKNTYS